MQASTRRVKSIYSVIASPNRIEILRILHTEGPLTYSELKSLAGFKSKKESGKFAYHLRKLVRQALISLNRSERKYVVTNLGRLILNLTRQIEEQAVIESGKLYVRTSRQTMEEFSADRILQSMVREAGMPVELAQKITSETEARLYKFQTTYLTAPLIREMVNALLIEHGLDEYRHRLTRLGLPVYDITELVNGASGTQESVQSVLMRTSHAVFSEYLMLAQLPRDVADAHLAGDVHISNAGGWGLVPDTVFYDLDVLTDRGLSLGPRLMSNPRCLPPDSLASACSALVTVAMLLSREASAEVCLCGFLQYIGNYAAGKTVEELRGPIFVGLQLISSAISAGYGNPTVTIDLNFSPDNRLEETLGKRIREASLLAYSEYVAATPIPRVNIVTSLPDGTDSDGMITNLAKAIHLGGKISVTNGGSNGVAFSGIRREENKIGRVDCTGVLHSLSLNLPRLAYESNRDETYFRAKLALLLQVCHNAVDTRRRLIHEMVRKGLLPVTGQSPGTDPSTYLQSALNLTGLSEAMAHLIGDKVSRETRMSMMEKILDTAAKMAGEGTGMAVLNDDSAARFTSIDSEKYGKGLTSSVRGGYSQAPVIEPVELQDNLLEEYSQTLKQLTAGFSATVSLSAKADIDDIRRILGACSTSSVPLRIVKRITVCQSCGTKALSEVSRCTKCRSASLMPVNLG